MDATLHCTPAGCSGARVLLGPPCCCAHYVCRPAACSNDLTEGVRASARALASAEQGVREGMDLAGRAVKEYVVPGMKHKGLEARGECVITPWCTIGTAMAGPGVVGFGEPSAVGVVRGYPGLVMPACLPGCLPACLLCRCCGGRPEDPRAAQAHRACSEPFCRGHAGSGTAAAPAARRAGLGAAGRRGRLCRPRPAGEAAAAPAAANTHRGGVGGGDLKGQWGAAGGRAPPRPPRTGPPRPTPIPSEARLWSVGAGEQPARCCVRMIPCRLSQFLASVPLDPPPKARSHLVNEPHCCATWHNASDGCRRNGGTVRGVTARVRQITRS